MAKTVDIIREPVEATYRELLRVAAEISGSFSLVWRDQLVFEPSAAEVTTSLREERTDEWPGTKLLGHVATVRRYRMAAEALAVLDRARGLYAWRAPTLPEDLVFYSTDGAVWLASIAHETDSWFEGGSELEAMLRRRLPGLALGHGGRGG